MPSDFDSDYDDEYGDIDYRDDYDDYYDRDDDDRDERPDSPPYGSGEEDEGVDRTGYVEEIVDDDDDNDAGNDAEGDVYGTEDVERTSDTAAQENSEPMSKYEYTEPWGGTGGFMDSYGIDRTPEGYQEANEMVDQMREAAGRDGGGGSRK
ncbi:hypothetical protein B0T20DRAFT_77804 [Sordaria brevicollis]|uniref:Uncharacterized protein n=1 Tax=Sordaria brevicollis TaxID=83679 RepID=A0AAE0U5P4_SORBR|nr:hypothetical protein B0T20DRAFT_77804 [Sordaria brevicollis]